MKIMMRILWLAVLLVAGTLSGQTTSAVPEAISVAAGQSFNGKPFTYTRTQREQNHFFAIHDISFPSPVVSPHPANNTVLAEVYLPSGVTREQAFPAVVCLHILNGNFDLERALCVQLAKRGVIALFFKQPYYGERGGTEGRRAFITSADAFVDALVQGFADTRRCIDLLQALPEVDPHKIGISGISLGAILAARACGFDPRISSAFLLLGGGDLRQIIETAREMRGIRAFIERLQPDEQEKVWARIEHLDPLQAVEALRKLSGQKRLRMIGAERDQVIPPACSRKLAEAAGCTDSLTWLPGLDHYSAVASLPQILGEVGDFFHVDVPLAWQPPPAAREKTATELVGVFLAGLAAFAQGEPAAESAHMMGVDVELVLNGKPQRAGIDYVRGQAGQFKLTGSYPALGQVGLGQGIYPWLIGAGRTVFCGTQEVRDGAVVSDYIAPEQMLKFRALSGVLGMAALAPEVLAKYWTLEEIRQTNGNRTVAVHIDHKKTQGTLKLDFASDATPLRADWSFGTVTGHARFTHWKLNTAVPDAVFEPPAELPTRGVLQQDLLRMFGAAFAFVVETVE